MKGKLGGWKDGRTVGGLVDLAGVGGRSSSDFCEGVFARVGGDLRRSSGSEVSLK